MDHWDDFLEPIKYSRKNKILQRNNNPTVEDVTAKCFPLLRLAMKYKPREHEFVREEKWKIDAKEYANLFIQCYGAAAVTPYIHVFVYHLGFYLETYDGVEKFANYPIEGCHLENKRNFQHSTNKFGGKTATANNNPGVQLLRIHNQSRMNVSTMDSTGACPLVLSTAGVSDANVLRKDEHKLPPKKRSQIFN